MSVPRKVPSLLDTLQFFVTQLNYFFKTYSMSLRSFCVLFLTARQMYSNLIKLTLVQFTIGYLTPWDLMCQNSKPFYNRR